MRCPFQASLIGILPTLAIGLLVGSLSAADAGKPLQPLWEIGKADGSYTEFALASQGYELFEDDGFFIVGRSDPKTAWPFVHPGPLDTWAGSREHTFTILFGVKQTTESGTGRLVFDLVDTHHADPPQLTVEINGRKFQQKLPKGAGNVSIGGDPAKGHHHQFTVEFPAALLKVGDNRVDIVSTAGSWFLYDRILLETPPKVVSGPVEQVTPPTLEVVSKDVRVSIDLGMVINNMRGGIGASWHAMEETIPYGVKHPTFTSYSHGGSGWGGYPPAEDERRWQQIYRHANWLGLDWNRVEIEQRIYEPERDRFTLDGPEMRILYRILDWNQEHSADVFFQQMWCNTAWLAYPEFRDDPVGRVHSAPADIDAFADGLATLMEHLIKKRGYTCIKWLCINNEPGAAFSWWQAPPNKPLSIGPGLAAVRKALDKRGLSLPLSGPDTTTAFPDKVPGGFEYLDLLGAYDFHDYGADFDFRTKGHIAAQERNASGWVQLAHAQNKPLFLSEFGTMAYGWVPDKPGPSCPRSVLAGSELVIRLANVGVDAFNRWSYLNRGDLDGQWQFVDTFDRQETKLLEDFPPHPNSYFCLGLLSRFTAKNSAVLASRVEGGQLGAWQRVFCAAFRSPRDNLTLAIVNDAPTDFNLQFGLQGLSKSVRLSRYRYGEAERDRTDVKVNPQLELTFDPAAAEVRDTLPPNSLTIYSTYKLEHEASGVIVE